MQDKNRMDTIIRPLTVTFSLNNSGCCYAFSVPERFPKFSCVQFLLAQKFNRYRAWLIRDG